MKKKDPIIKNNIVVLRTCQLTSTARFSTINLFSVRLGRANRVGLEIISHRKKKWVEMGGGVGLLLFTTTSASTSELDQQTTISSQKHKNTLLFT
jgi:hypothetical protein